MHELSLCENIVRILEEKSQKEKFTRVVAIRLAVGDVSGASREALAFCFPLVAKGTLAQEAALTFEETPGRDLRVTGVEVV